MSSRFSFSAETDSERLQRRERLLLPAVPRFAIAVAGQVSGVRSPTAADGATGNGRTGGRGRAVSNRSRIVRIDNPLAGALTWPRKILGFHGN